MPWQEPNMTQRRLTLMVGWWTRDIATAAASDNARPLMEGGVGTWHQHFCEAASNTVYQAGMATEAEEAVQFWAWVFWRLKDLKVSVVVFVGWLVVTWQVLLVVQWYHRKIAAGNMWRKGMLRTFGANRFPSLIQGTEECHNLEQSFAASQSQQFVLYVKIIV